MEAHVRDLELLGHAPGITQAAEAQIDGEHLAVLQVHGGGEGLVAGAATSHQ